MMHAAVAPSPAPFPSTDTTRAGGRLVSTTGRALPLLGTSLTADASGGVARVVVEQRFHNPHAEPLAVTYSLPLPADGAVSGFAFRIGGRRVVGEVDRKKAARERYEQALVDGRSAAILEQDRSSLFTQEIGNIPPGEEIIAEVIIDQRLRWLDEGAWEWRFPTVVGPRYLGEAGRVQDAARVVQDIADAPLAARLTLTCSVRDALVEGRRPESPSHALTTFETRGALRIELSEKLGARLDRDVVVRWPVASPRVGLTIDSGRAPAEHARSATAYGLLTVVPPSLESSFRSVPRDLIVLLDTSGSMGGEPLAQAQRITLSLIDTLRDDDRLELIEFSSSTRRWKRGAVAATRSARAEASAWVRALQASGSTEMRTGILEALDSLREGSQRQIVLITDGMIGFESQVVAAIETRLPASSRVHTVGVGSSVNRSLTGPAARAGRGLEVVIGIGEDPERAVSRLLARTSAPLLVELEVAGSAVIDHAPLKLPDLFAGAPALIGVAMRPEGGEIVVRGRTAEGAWEQRLHIAAIDAGTGNQAVIALFGREAVEDLETHLAGGGDKREIDATIERLGVDFQIATRLTSWIAVSRDVTVDPRDALRHERMPHDLPYGMSAEGVGLRAPSATFAAALPAMIHTRTPKTGIDGGDGGGGGGASGGAVRGGAPRSRGRFRDSASDETDERALRRGRSPKGGAWPDDGDDEAMPSDARRSSSAPRPGSPTTSDKLESPDRKKEEGGFVEKMKRVFGFGEDRPQESGERAAPPPAGAPAPRPAAAPPPPPRQLAPEKKLDLKPQLGRVRRNVRGRVVVHSAVALIVELLIENRLLDWSPDATAQIELSDGTMLTAKVDLTKTTRPGSIAVAASARLALDLPHGAALVAPIRITIECNGATIVVDL
ncbi:MAG: VIT domain-containing protein [Byssovorax sp.]